MEQDIRRAYDIGAKNFPKISSKFFDYGTSGFRDKAKELGFIVYRMGLLAVLKSKAEEGCTVGLMLTASHNPEEDNGVKLCRPQGDMLDKEWEMFATELINANEEDFIDVLKKIAALVDYNVPANVFLGKDTRASSDFLLDAAISGIKALNGGYKSFGLVTTPQLHYLVVCQNDGTYGESTLEGYYKKLSGAFEKLKLFRKVRHGPNYDSCLYIDGANGVGAHKMREMIDYQKSLSIQIFNDGSSGILNYKCGADYVKVDQTFPEGTEILKNKRYASFDGDADRVVYFYCDEASAFHLLDGDKIASLVAKYLQELVEHLQLNLAMRVIQTAYANGKSTSYIENKLKIPVVCVPTGVKHLHSEAKKYDISVYFEANGHGTVLFSEKAKREIQALANDTNASELQLVAARKLLTSIDLINETVGDAISDLLLVEAILYDFDWNIQDWDAMYTDYACRQLKVKVPDRRAIQTTDAERQCTLPVGLQEAINSSLCKFPNSRAFVRPSGTEDVVRVYAEAENQELADSLAQEISSLVVKFTS